MPKSDSLKHAFEFMVDRMIFLAWVAGAVCAIMLEGPSSQLFILSAIGVTVSWFGNE